MTYGRSGPAHPRLGKLVSALVRPWCRWKYARHDIYEPDSPFARERIASLQLRLARGDSVYLAGVGVSGHNSGAALLEVSQRQGMRLISNDEEERFTGIKHCSLYPVHSLESLKQRLVHLGKTPADLHAVLLSWNYPAIACLGYQSVVEHFPASLALTHEGAVSGWDFFRNGKAARRAPERLGAQFGLPGRQPLICMPHHENHAAFSYAMSPFNHSDRPVMITVLDGFGDEGAISLYLAENGHLARLRKNDSLSDSLGAFYSIISSTQGGWTVLSSEGRYMGAVAWGDRDRLTNPFYRRLRQIFYFGEDGEVLINRSMANWHLRGERDPYARLLRDAIGDPLPVDRMWNPDSVLRVDDLNHAESTTARVDLAAATQLVFEDVLFHIVDHLIRSTGSDQLVMAGGTALNCLANMHLVERYDTKWYRRHLGKHTRLHIWVPPIPGDAGAGVGAACAFALRAGISPGAPLRHAFWCGLSPATSEILQALEANGNVDHRPLGNIRERLILERIADRMARVVAADGVVGLFQGAAETGPRALGHRSILANPCNPETLQTINRRVKYREPIRPLAPMATLSAAKQFFKLSAGAADDDFNAYSYMVLAASALPAAIEKIPAVVHKDGTGRLQIVREQHDPLTYAYLKAMGRHAGVEVSVNTSLNVGSPIVQTPEQALEALTRAHALSGLVMVGADGQAFFVWHRRGECPAEFDVESAEELACSVGPTT